MATRFNAENEILAHADRARCLLYMIKVTIEAPDKTLGKEAIRRRWARYVIARKRLLSKHNLIFPDKIRDDFIEELHSLIDKINEKLDVIEA